MRGYHRLHQVTRQLLPLPLPLPSSITLSGKETKTDEGEHVGLDPKVAASLVSNTKQTLRHPGANIPETEQQKLYASRQIALLKAQEEGGLTHLIEKTGTAITELHEYKLLRLQEMFPDLPTYKNVFVRTRHHLTRTVKKGKQANHYNATVLDTEMILMDIVRKRGTSGTANGFVRAGPRDRIVWTPAEVKAAIVTCGGLCPGLNDVVQELVSCLYYNYGVDTIYGIRSGYRGFWDKEFLPWIKLTPENTKGIHNSGGTILGSSRGGFDLEKMMEVCERKGVNQLYIIGGDGTHRGAILLAQEAVKRGLKMTIAGIPKTIDNDIGVIDWSFGFNTAVAEARRAIRSAVVEASCAPNGIGVVKLMGREAGHITAISTLASREVDLCLIPEVPFPIEGQDGILVHIEESLKNQGYCVMVVAEGAGQDLMKGSTATDESGNKVLPEIGMFIQQKIHEYFKKKGMNTSIKYHDPSYMIRSVPANASDSVLCILLAQNAVHGAMAGYTGFTSAVVNNRTVLLPMSVIAASSPSYLNPNGRTWERVCNLTHQPRWEAASHVQKQLGTAPAAQGSKPKSYSSR